VAELSVDPDAWIRRFHASEASGFRLVCFPHAGGSASFYFPMSRALRARAEVLAVQYPGRQDRRAEEPVRDIGTLADRVAQALRGQPADRLILFGHSMGAIVAFEVARRMERGPGGAPPMLIVSGRRAPSRSRDDRVHLRDDNGLIAELKALSGPNETLLDNEEVIRMILPTVRNDYRAIETYVCKPGEKISCPITAFIGDNDPRVSLDEVRAWSEHTTGSFDLRVFRGGHFYLVNQREEVVGAISDILRLT
jgi:surfactin synthase thioesterase subunit